MTTSNIGGVADPRPKHTQARDKRVKAARTNAYRDAHQTPRHIARVLSNPDRFAHRFTPWQWAVLNVAWGQWSGYRTSEQVAESFGVDPRSVRKARRSAEVLCIELVYVWEPALKRWQAGEMLPEDRAILAKHKRAKSGRYRTFPRPVEVPTPQRSAYGPRPPATPEDPNAGHNLDAGGPLWDD